MEDAAGQITSAVRAVVDTKAGTSLSTESHQLLSLNPSFGGAGLRVPEQAYNDACFWGTYLADRNRLTRLAQQLQTPAFFT